MNALLIEVQRGYLVWRTTRSRRYADFSWGKKALLVVVDSTNSLTILTVRVASNFQTDMKSPRIETNRNTRNRMTAEKYIL